MLFVFEMSFIRSYMDINFTDITSNSNFLHIFNSLSGFFTLLVNYLLIPQTLVFYFSTQKYHFFIELLVFYF